MYKQEILGEGAYGKVYRCGYPGTKWDGSSAKRNIVGSKISFMASVREFDLLMKFRGHPNIVYLSGITFENPYGVEHSPTDEHDVKDDPLHFFFETADCDLSAHMKRGCTLSEARHFLFDMLQGIKYIHSAGYIHRDIKPANLLLFHDANESIKPTGRKYIKYCDFGLGKPLIKGKAYTPRLITSWYRPPEIIFAEPYDPAADIWSIGIVLYEMIAGSALLSDVKNDAEEALMSSLANKLPEACFEHLPEDHRWRNQGYKLGTTSLAFMTPYYKYCTSLPKEANCSINDLTSLFIRILNVVPSKRATVDEILQHPFLLNIPSNLNVTLMSPSIITIHQNKERRFLYSHLYEIMKASRDQDWYAHRIIFMTTTFIDRYIDYKIKEKVPDHSEDSLILRLLVMLYLAIKYHSTYVDCLAFNEFVDKNYRDKDSLEFAEAFEKVLINRVLESKIHQVDLYEFLHPTTIKDVDDLYVKLKDIVEFRGTIQELVSHIN